MASKKSSRRSNPHARKLVRAGYRRLPRFLLALAKLCLANPFVYKPALLPRRKITVLGRVSRGGQHCFRLSVATGGLVQERAVAKLTISCFSLFGMKLSSVNRHDTHQLFADPLDTIEPQPIYFALPKGAFWVTATIERLTDTQHVGMVGSLRPNTIVSSQRGGPVSSLEQALNSRDRLALETHLEQARVACDRKTACLVLARLVFLEHREHDQTLLRQINDIQHTLDHLPAARRAGHDMPGFDYKELQTAPWKNSVLLSSWLKSEILGLDRSDLPVVSVGAGPNEVLRLMAAVHAGKMISLDGTGDWDTGDLPWISKRDIDAILALTHESAPL